MIYSANITTLKLGDETLPKRTTLRVTKGLVYKVEVDFPPGSAGLMGVAIYDGGYQVWPSNIGQWFTGDNTKLSFDDVYLKESAPYQFIISTYNNDTAYPHLVIIRIGLVSKKVFMARFLPSLSYELFEEMLARLQVEQTGLIAEQRQAVIETPFPWLA